MIDRQHGKIVICCDACDDTFEGEKGEEFSSVWAGAKREGWRSKKVGGDWLHLCPGPSCGQKGF